MARNHIIAIVGLLLLVACTHQPPACSGPIFPLNSGQWQPTPEELR